MTKIGRENNYFKPLASKRAFEEISDQIKELIQSGVFKSGDKLPPERELAKQFNVGRMAVREALRVLEDSDLINVKQGSSGGSFINAPKTSNIFKTLTTFANLSKITPEQLTEARLAVELSSIELVIKRITRKELDQLKQIIDGTQKAIGGPAVPISSYTNFHLALVRATGNPLLESFLAAIINIDLGYMGRKKPNKETALKHIEDHQVIYQSILKKDVNTAKNILKSHILYVDPKVMRSTRKQQR